MSHWLSRFILEAKLICEYYNNNLTIICSGEEKNGSEFTPTTLHHIICGIMRYLRLNGRPELDFFYRSRI